MFFLIIAENLKLCNDKDLKKNSSKVHLVLSSIACQLWILK